MAAHDLLSSGLTPALSSKFVMRVVTLESTGNPVVSQRWRGTVHHASPFSK